MSEYDVTYEVTGTYTVHVEADSEEEAAAAADKRISEEIHDFGEIDNGEMRGPIYIS